MKLRTRMFLMLVVILSALAVNLAAFMAFSSMSAELQVLEARTLSLNGDVSKFRYLTSELITRSNFQAAFDAWSSFVPRIDASMQSYLDDKALSRRFNSLEATKAIATVKNIWEIAKIQRELLAGAAETLAGRLGSNPLLSIYGGAKLPPGAIQVVSGAPSLVVQLESYIENSLAVLSNSAVATVSAGQRLMNLLVIALSLACAGATAGLLVTFSRALGSSLAAFETAIGAWNGRDFTLKVEAAGRDELSALGRQINGTIGDFAAFIGRVSGMADGAAAVREDVLSASSETAASMEQIGANISSIHARIEEMSGRLGSTSEAAAAIGRGVASLDERLAAQNEALARSSSLAAGMAESASKADAIAESQAAAASRLDELAGTVLERLSQAGAAIAGTQADVGRCAVP
jgi:hypothetical protein